MLKMQRYLTPKLYIRGEVVLAFLFFVSLSINVVVGQGQPHEEGAFFPVSSTTASNEDASVESCNKQPDRQDSYTESRKNRKLRDTDDYTKIGSGLCNVDNNDLKTREKGTTNPSWKDCVNLCGNSVTGFAFAEKKWEHCKGWDWLNCASGYETRYRLNCFCYSGSPVTGTVSEGIQGIELIVGSLTCYAYNKGDQLAGTSKEDSFYYAGQGQCVGTVNSEVFSYTSHSGYETDLECANKCFSSIAFSRRLSDSQCRCYSQETGTGDVKASSDDNFNCYSRLYDRIFEDSTRHPSAFTYVGIGEYSTSTAVGTKQTDAQCAETCLDTYKNIGGIIGITHEKNGGTCYCATDGTVSGTNKLYTSYSLDTSSRVFDCPDNSDLQTTLSDGDTTLQTVCKCANNNSGGTAKTLSIEEWETCACPAPTDWCIDSEHDKHNIAFDCDSDGNNDSLCVTKDGYQVLNSQNECIVATGTDVVADCYAAGYGNVLPSSTPEFFWRGIGLCKGSYANPNQEQFSHFEIQADVLTDVACAEACAERDEYPHKIVSFSRRVYLNRCYCQYQKNTAEFDGTDGVVSIYNGDGVGGVVKGDDHRYSCYGHYQEGNQVIDSSAPFLVNDGRTRHELKGLGPCRDSDNRQFPHFEIADQSTDDLCWKNCESEYSDIVGIARHQISNSCFCHYDSESTVSSDSVNYEYLRPHGTGVGEAFAGFLDDFHCVGRVQGLSGFDFKGNGPCKDSNGNEFPHFQIQGQLTSHTDAECGARCLWAFPDGIIGFWRHKKDFDCYCMYEYGDTIPGTVSTASLGGATGTGRHDVTAAGTELAKSCYGLDETSRVTDCPFNSALVTKLNSDGLKVLESWCNCDNGNGKNVYDNGDTCNCTRPYRWCAEPADEYFYMDCDSDGTLDSVCTNDEGYKTLKSQNACNQEEGEDVDAVCSAAGGCSKSDGWCNGAGEVYSLLDCDGDGAKDSVCKENDGSYKVALSSNNCVNEASVTIDEVCPAVKACLRNNTWCTERGNRYFFIDCDGDGALDSMCQTGNTSYLLKRSSDGCVETSVDNTTLATRCPASGCIKPKAWCGHPGSQYYYVDCDGDNILDSHCRDEDGRSWAILSGKDCKRSRDRCPAADFCTHRDDWCLQAGSHFYSVDPKGEYGNGESQCILDIGTQWEDTNCYKALTDVRKEREYILSKT